MHKFPLIFFVYPGPPAGGERRTDDAERRSSTKSKSIYSPWGWGK